MPHVPFHDSWRPNDLAQSFRDLGIQSEVRDQRVSVVIPILELLSLDKILAAATPGERTPNKVGVTTATLSYCFERLIDNILIDLDINLLKSWDRCPDFSCVKKALEKCGYVFGSALEIVQLYLPDDSEALGLINEIEILDLRKEDLIVAKDYVGARSVLQEKTLLQTKLEEKIRNLRRKNGG